MGHKTYGACSSILAAMLLISPLTPGAYADSVAQEPYTSTREFIDLNLYDYNGKINSHWNENRNYPGFQWNGGAYEGSRGTGLYIVDAIDFGNSKITDFDYVGKNHGKSSTSTAVGNAGGDINSLDTSAGVTNRPVGMSRGKAVLANVLIDGYPALKDGSSLAWLFTENEAVKKLNTESIDGLFLQDRDTGLYSYNSRENHAQYSDNMFTRYDGIITANFITYPFGNFLPFNDITSSQSVTNVGSISDTGAYIDEIQGRLGASATDVQLEYMLGKYKNALSKAGLSEARAGEVLRDFISSGKGDSPGATAEIPDRLLDRMYNIDWDVETNFFFGMDMSMNFLMPQNGLTGMNNDTPMRFSFTGDDDVWVYVDGVLFLDLSGIHRHVGGTIDFAQGRVYYYGLDEKSGDVNMDGADAAYASYSFEELLLAAGKDSSVLNSKGTFKDDSSHEFKFYYMERGSGSSVCSIAFNFPLLPQTGGPEIEDEQPMLETKEDNDTCQSLLTIPGLKLELPLWGRWSYEKLKTAPCRYTGSIGSGNLVILGHNYAEHFGSINRLNEGDRLSITDAEGGQTCYVVAAQEILEAWDWERLNSGGYELSLMTCTDDGTQRRVVRCKKIIE